MNIKKYIEEQENIPRKLKNNMIKEFKFYNTFKSYIKYVKSFSHDKNLTSFKAYKIIKDIWNSTKRIIFRIKRKHKKKNFFYNFTKKKRYKRKRKKKKT